MKVGFIQSGAIGDILIALPAAKWYADRGYEVFWPINQSFVPFFQKAAPYVQFLPVPPDAPSYDYLLGLPQRALAAHGVTDIFILYIYLGSNGQKFEFGQPPRMPDALKFDEYKYAITGVPFAEKWNLHLERDADAEARVLEAISAHIPYTIVHESPAGNRRNIESQLPPSEATRVLRVQTITDSPFDWLAAFERADIIACEDSLYANLVEQHNIATKKYLFLRSACRETPVFKNGWLFR